jgi:hypothetical protein
MPTRFCLKNMGDPSSMYMTTPIIKYIGDKIINKKTAIILFIDNKSFKYGYRIPTESLSCFEIIKSK